MYFKQQNKGLLLWCYFCSYLLFVCNSFTVSVGIAGNICVITAAAALFRVLKKCPNLQTDRMWTLCRHVLRSGVRDHWVTSWSPRWHRIAAPALSSSFSGSVDTRVACFLCSRQTLHTFNNMAVRRKDSFLWGKGTLLFLFSCHFYRCGRSALRCRGCCEIIESFLGRWLLKTI